MIEKIRPPAEALPAFGTRIRLKTRVSPLVGHEIGLVCEAFPTRRTRIRLFPRVYAFMGDQVGFLREAFPADGTRVRPVAVVDPLVRDQVRLVRKGFSAFRAGHRLRAFQGFLTRVKLGPLGKTLVQVETRSHDLAPGDGRVVGLTGEVGKSAPVCRGVRGQLCAVQYRMEVWGDGAVFRGIGCKFIVFYFNIWITYSTFFQTVPHVSPI